MRIEGKIEAVNSQPRNTKYGTRPCHFITVAGERYQLGFGKLEVKVGDYVSFEEGDKGYGKEVTKGSLVVNSPSAVAPAAAPAAVEPAPVSSGRSSSKQAGVFPIPPLSPERAIIRQNAMTQAREMIVGLIGADGPRNDTKTWTERQSQFETITKEILRLAPRFEAYAAGDIDMAEAKAEVKASS